MLSNINITKLIFENEVNILSVHQIFKNSENIIVIDDIENNKYPLVEDCQGRQEVFVGRIRKDFSNPNILHLWCVADNLVKGAAANALQIAEKCFKQKIFGW
jgi:aspartate-semialdehyde dehydrogenase